MIGVRAVIIVLIISAIDTSALLPYHSAKNPAGTVETKEPQKKAPSKRLSSDSLHSYLGPY